MFLQAKSEPRSAAPSAGPVVNLPAQPTSSHASAPTNTVRIEKLSDDENEEVDITDDLSNDGDGDHKPQVVLKTEFGEPEQLKGIESQTDSPTEEQKEAGLTETMDQRSHFLPSPQSPRPSSSLPCSEKTGVTGLDEKANGRVSPDPQHLHTAALLASEVMTEENEGQSSQSESSPQTGQLEEGGSDGTGKTVAFM